MPEEKAKTVDEYISNKDIEIQPFLMKIREIIKRSIPEATEKIAWNMPSYWKDKYIIHFECYRNHVNIYVGPVITDLYRSDEKYKGYKFTGRGVSVSYKQEIPEKMIEEMAKKSLEMVGNQ